LKSVFNGNDPLVFAFSVDELYFGSLNFFIGARALFNGSCGSGWSANGTYLQIISIKVA
jgi:hypothetical protein